ncbi:hypothetical protein N9043_00155 [bacterium]|nr:hypothetical protein [bacterium]
MLHKSYKNEIVNMINYMAAPSRGMKPSFIGFIKETDSHWGCNIDGEYYTAVHDGGFRKKIVSDDERKETIQIEDGLTYVLYLQGSDNTSFVKRFKDKKSAYNWFIETKSVCNDDESLLWYDS